MSGLDVLWAGLGALAFAAAFAIVVGTVGTVALLWREGRR